MAKDKKSFVLRINSETMSALEKWAADEFRSANGQVEFLITEALKKTGRLRTVTDSLDGVNDR
ncbi:MAG: DNA-binding protein [Bacteroidaceae bacterium]|nr:DNA-binding protein [Bacteroidaceae bacterium]